MAGTGDGSLSDDDHRRVAQEMFDRWHAGEPKSALEIEFWDNPTSHGKAFTAYVKKWLGIATEGRSRQAQRIEELERMLRVHGIPPSDSDELSVEYLLVAKARESALAALRAFNDPSSGYRTEQFILLMVIAWNSLLQAILEREGIDYFDRDDDRKIRTVEGRPRILDTDELIGLAGEERLHPSVAENLRYFLRLRNRIAHRYLPALDAPTAGYAQSMLINFEEVLVSNFGAESALGDQLYLPLQIGKFRREPELKRIQAQLPLDIVEFLDRERRQVPEEILGDARYCMRIFFVSTTANRERSADAAVTFVKSDEVSDELLAALPHTAIVTKPKRVAVASDDLHRPSDVVERVSSQLNARFTMDTHTRCWKYFKVRPPSDAGEPEATDQRYCRYDKLAGGYGYTSAWVEKLVRDLRDQSTYARIVGRLA
ncbi:DUF3644 domain-containing protein [Candidatus Poriferisodalis sp.]|uniref:DUF3644 domain-containing protein n=1 Tax=Candidatus Poriferisodalis sp. TaxID=3101277 RepID=UPI003B0242F5